MPRRPPNPVYWNKQRPWHHRISSGQYRAEWLDAPNMIDRLHFISGLPRSGSTLLSAVLQQNPRFHAAMTSPVALLCFTLLPEMSPPAQFAALFDDARRCTMLRGVFEGYYSPVPRPVVFDTNRVWCGNVPLTAALFPDARIICCVREIGWIIDSVERMLGRNPLLASRIFPGQFSGGERTNIYARTAALMNFEIGLIGGAWANLREAWFGPFADRLLLFSYEGFAADPSSAMRKLYAALGEPWFAHDFQFVSYDASDYDTELGMPGLHRVAARITPPSRIPNIPPDLFKRYEASAFWRNPAQRANGPTLIC